MNGRAFTPGALDRRKPGETVQLEILRRDGRVVPSTLTFREDPRLEAVPVEAAGGTLTAAHRAFRDAWLGAKR